MKVSSLSIYFDLGADRAVLIEAFEFNATSLFVVLQAVTVRLPQGKVTVKEENVCRGKTARCPLQLPIEERANILIPVASNEEPLAMGLLLQPLSLIGKVILCKHGICVGEDAILMNLLCRSQSVARVHTYHWLEILKWMFLCNVPNTFSISDDLCVKDSALATGG